MYEWDQVEDSYYEASSEPEVAAGLSFDALRVERTNEGWHGILTYWCEPDEEYEYEGQFTGGEYVMLDEKVFPTKAEAESWCEERDTAKYGTDYEEVWG
jgi:hypothetical protein